MERAVLRIIDANFNRAREAARVIEEYCRFWLNCEGLSARAKSLRHRLSALVGRLDKAALICSRDSEGDVGRGMVVDGQLDRRNLVDCFTAATKRLTEALRALAEMTRIVEPSLSEEFERLRFEAYTLEKDIGTFSEVKEKFSPVRLYIVLSVTQKIGDGEVIELMKRCIEGRADCIQLRAKGITDRRTFKLAAELVDICRGEGVISIINDRVDIAAIAGADGVHLGQDDLKVENCRSIQFSPMIFGRSTHSVEQLKSAIEEGADYVSVGPVFASPTKPSVEVAGLEYVEKALDLLKGSGIGHVAIGGINHENLGLVLEKGVRAVAVGSAVMNSNDVEKVCGKLKERVTRDD
jgi:thiamine-phosphate pyrophosphorylase